MLSRPSLRANQVSSCAQSQDPRGPMTRPMERFTTRTSGAPADMNRSERKDLP